MKNANPKLAIAALAAACAPAFSGVPLRMDMEGIVQPVLNEQGNVVDRPNVEIGGFYAAQGVTFSSGVNAIEPVSADGVNDWFGNGNFRLIRTMVGGPYGGTSPALGYGAFLPAVASNGRSEAVLNVPAGFNDGLSFYFNSAAPLSVSLLLGDSQKTLDDFTFPGGITCVGDYNNRCEWAFVSIDFVDFNVTGSAFGVRFSGAENDFLVDEIRLFDVNPIGEPPTVPEPGTYALMAVGLAAAGFTVRRRRQRLR